MPGLWPILAPKSIEDLTLVERLVSVIPLPYTAAAFVWSVTVFGPLSYIILEYLSTGAVSLPNLPNVILNFLLLFYSFLMVRYIRTRILAAETNIAPRLSGGTEAYRRAFGRMTQTLPVVVIAASMGAFFVALDVSLEILPTVPVLIGFNIAIALLDSLAFATYLWEFVVASWGLSKLGGTSLNLESFQADRLMGTRPMGNLALALTVAYFGALLLALLLFSTFLPSTPSSTATFAAFLLVGVALFFLPLRSLHNRMLAEKRRLVREVGARYPSLHHSSAPRTDHVTLDDVHARLTRLTELQELEILDRKVAGLPTWPFDIQVASRFVTIVLSVATVLVARVLTDFLRI